MIDATRDLSELMLQRDESDDQCDPELVDRLANHGREWCFWQGYIEAICDSEGLDLAKLESEYRQGWRDAVAAGEIDTVPFRD